MKVWQVMLAIAVFIAASSIVGELAADELYISGGLAYKINSDFKTSSGTYDEHCGGSYHKKKNCSFSENFEEIGNNFGQLEIGYRHGIWENGTLVTYIQHTSDLSAKDEGLDLIGFKIEHRWKVK